MHTFSLTKKQSLVLGASVLGLAVVSLLVPASAWAQLPNFTGVQSTLRTKIAPLITLIRYLIAVVAVLAGMFEAFKATRGNAKGWIPAVLLWVVAAIVIAPGTVIQMLGMSELYDNLSGWGLGW